MFSYQAVIVMSAVAMGNAGDMVKRLKQKNPQQSRLHFYCKWNVHSTQ
jgi:hypothetical protein